MLRIHQSESAACAKRYYTEGLGRPDYYTPSAGGQGQWFGTGAARLGLSGDVTREAFFALIDNTDPATGQRLTARDNGPERRPGWDLVFSPPKSVSVVRAITGDERITTALWDSARETLVEIERDAVRTRLRRDGQRGDTPTGNLVASLFLHDTTRPLPDGTSDPHDHIHAYVHNATFAAHEGRWQAAEMGEVFLRRPYYEAAFEARLAHKLAALGYQVERRALSTSKVGWELAGVPPRVVAEFSRRTTEIEQAADRLGLTDPAAKAALGARTRRGKPATTDAATLRDDWRQRLSADERRALADLATSARTSLPAPAGSSAAAVQAMGQAVDHLFARDSVVPVDRLLETALRVGVGRVTPESLTPELSGHGLVLADHRGRAVATTHAMLAVEQSLVRFARAGSGRCDPLGGYSPPPTLAREFLNPQQQRAVRHLLASFDRVMVLRGKAGVGKSTLLAEVRDQITARGRQVLAVAPTTGATEVLRADGFHAETIAALLSRPELQQQLRGNVLLVDEAGLVGAVTMKSLFDLAERYGTRVILCGDTGQHRGVEAGAALRLLEERAGVRPAEVTEIQRQRGAFKTAVAALASGDAGEGFDRLDALGMVREVADDADRHRALAWEYAESLARGQQVLAISPTRCEGARVTEAIRAELRNAGLIGGDEHTVMRLDPRHLTDAEKRDATAYTQGDVLQFIRATRGVAERGERLAVCGHDGDAIRVFDAAGKECCIPLTAVERFQVYRPQALPLAIGDRIRMTQNTLTQDGKHRLVNGAVYTLAGFTAGGDLRLDNGWVLGREIGHIAPGWVITSHAAQGRTISGPVFVAQGAESRAATSREQFYVSASRSRSEVRVFTDDKTALRTRIERSDRPLLASELDHRPPAFAVERHRRARYLARVRPQQPVHPPAAVRHPPRSEGRHARP